ncbi:MAG: spore cortex biosynthesis protein YabQ [Oscillospiraceae bacterium]
MLETFFTPNEQLSQFVLCIIIGVGLGIFFDFFRVARVLLPHKNFLTAIEDIVFLLIWGVVLLVFSMEIGRGEVRIFFLLGNILGFTLYHFTLGNFVVKLLRKIISTIYRVLQKVFSVVFRPFRKIFALFCQNTRCVFVKICSKFKKPALCCKKHLKDDMKLLYNTSKRNILKNGKKKGEGKVGKGKKVKIQKKHSPRRG